jgi:FkbM family methyltransferase
MKKIFFDLGAGVKNSEAWCKDLWKDYIIIGVEPDLTRYNELKDIFPGKLLNLAISDKEEEISGIIHDTSGFIVGGYPGYNKFIKIKAVTLDSIYKQYFNPEEISEIAIWADIEGSELRMLRGATEVLKKTNWINVELHTHPQTNDWCNSSDVYKFLEKLGFKTETKEKPYTPNHDSCYDALFIRNI